MRAVIRLRDPQQAHKSLVSLWADLKPWLIAGHSLEVEVRKERRSTEQNALLWAMLSDVSKQVVWHGKKLTPDEWKCVFTAALKRQEVVPGINGGFVVIGAYTSRMTREQMSELIDLISAFGAEHGVEFKEEETA